MEFLQTLPTPVKEVTAGTNTCEIFVFHHTATAEGTIKGVLNGLAVRLDEASCHLVIDEDGHKYKIGNDTDILRHCGKSSWGKFKQKNGSVNAYAIGLELIGPLKNGGFTDQQFDSAVELSRYYIKKYGIKKENVVRHKDIAPGRKVDVADTFRNKKFKTWELFKDFLFSDLPKMTAPSKYTAIFEQTIKETGFEPIFTLHEGSSNLTEQETKELIEIALARFANRMNGKKITDTSVK